MRIVPAIESEIRREIRDARAIDPLISISVIEHKLEEKFNRGFSYRYVAKLVDKVGRQALIEAVRSKIEERLNFTRENYRLVRERSGASSALRDSMTPHSKTATSSASSEPVIIQLRGRRISHRNVP